MSWNYAVDRAMMMSIANVQMMEQNLEILYTVLGQPQLFEQILLNGQYDFYVTHMLNYFESYQQGQSRLSLVAKTAGYLADIFEHIFCLHKEDKQVVFRLTQVLENGMRIFYGLLKLMLGDPLHLAVFDDGIVIKRTFHVLDKCKHMIEKPTKGNQAAAVSEIFQSLSRKLLKMKNGDPSKSSMDRDSFNDIELMKFYLAFYFYLREFNITMVTNSQNFFRSFLSDENYGFFDCFNTNVSSLLNYLKFKLRNSDQIDLDDSPQELATMVRKELEVKLSILMNVKITLKIQTTELFVVLINMLHSFPRLDSLEQLRPNTIVVVATYLENLMKQLGDMLPLPEESWLQYDIFEPTSQLRLRDFSYLLQHNLLFFKCKSNEYKYCFLSLIFMLLNKSKDKLAMVSQVISLAIPCLATKNQYETANDCIGRFINPCVQVINQCWGLIDQEFVFLTNQCYTLNLQQNRKAMTELTYSYLNNIKMVPLTHKDYNSRVDFQLPSN